MYNCTVISYWFIVIMTLCRLYKMFVFFVEKDEMKAPTTASVKTRWGSQGATFSYTVSIRGYIHTVVGIRGRGYTAIQLVSGGWCHQGQHSALQLVSGATCHTYILVASVSGGPGHHSAIQLVSGQHTVVSMRGPPGAT